MIKLGELAWACYLYARFTNFDKAYIEFIKNTNNVLDLRKNQHRKLLLSWLNKWGCRQFSKEYHDLASEKIYSWYCQNKGKLFNNKKELLSLTKEELLAITEAYDLLKDCAASIRKLKKDTGKEVVVSFGPTGASKILFAIRPKALVPWDKAIRESLKYNGGKESFLAYLNHVKSELQELSNICKKQRIKLSDLPKLFNRPHSYVPKLLDEYYWVTVSNKCPSPDKKTLKLWSKWI